MSALHNKRSSGDTIFRVSISDGVLEDRLFEKTMIVYSDEIYNKDGTRKPEYFGRYHEVKASDGRLNNVG